MTKRYLTIPVMVAGLGFGTAIARAAEPQTQPSAADLMKQIDELQSKVQKLETQQQSAVTSKQVDETVTRVLQDADKRSQLMQMEGFTAGWNNDRFQIGSANGDFSLMPYFQMQFRNTTNIDTSSDGNTENGFSLPRVKLGFDGTIWHNFQYYFRWNSGDSDGGGAGALNLEQAYVRWQYADQMAFKAGQYVDPVFHEQLVNSDSQLAADRSILNEIITGADESYTQGVSMIWGVAQNVSLELAFTDGVNSGNSSFRDFPTNSANFGVAGRLEWALMGNKDSYNRFTAMGAKEDSFVVGAGVDWTQSGDTNNVLHTVDAQWNGMEGKLQVYGAFVGQWLQNGTGTGITGVTGTTDQDSYNYGVLVQAGYMLNENWEIFGRYDFTGLDDNVAVGNGTNTEDNFHELTGGVNYYFHGEHAKVTVDLTYLPHGAPAGLSNLGILSSDNDEFVIRAQLSLML